MEVIARYSKIPPPLKVPLARRQGRRPTAPPRVHDVQRRLGAETAARLAVDYEAGASTTELMQTYCLGKGTVLGLLQDAGVKMRGQGIDPSQLPELTRLYAEGWSLMRLASQSGCSGETIRQALMTVGVTLRKSWEREPRQA